MYCTKCGKEINDEAVICPFCGCKVERSHKKVSTQPTYDKPEIVNIVTKFDEDRKVLGLVLTLFFNFIPIIVGLFVFPEGTRARATFTKGCLIALLIDAGLAVLTIVPIFLFYAASFGVAVI